MTVCEECYSTNLARVEAERKASIVPLTPSPPPTDAEIKDTNARIAESIYRFCNVLSEIPPTIIEAAIAAIEPPEGHPRMGECTVDVPALPRPSRADLPQATKAATP